jgi:CRISPR/Cas system CSM-associated protein Csm3 (group 7 of RAMP superfamily)
MADRIKERIFIKGVLNLQTPCMIGSGNSLNTDNDVLVNGDNKPFIPGTTLAGVFRSYLADSVDFNNEDKELKYLFGSPLNIKDKISTTVSNIYISDANCISDFQILVRDGVELNKYKSAVDKSKYDYEVISPQTKFEFHIEVLLREKFDYYKDNKLISEDIDYGIIKDYLARLLIALEEERISIGSKTRRGYGLIKLEDVKVELIDDSDYKHFVNFTFNNIKPNVNYRDWLRGDLNNSFYELEVNLELASSLIIRKYVDELDKDDVPDQIMLRIDNNTPVIPGTSWSGCFRHRTIELFKELDIDINLVNKIFGYVDEVNDDNSTYSKFTFIESCFENYQYRVVRRNKIDRFSGGAVDKALFDEEFLEKGNTVLRIRIDNEYENYIGILLIILDEINNGLLALGGETGIGRGLFKVINVKLNNENLTNELKNEYLSRLIVEIKKEGDYAN